MRVENSLFLKMIGDFYLHSYVLKHSDIIKNNYTSNTIYDLFDNTSNSLYGEMFKIGNKIKTLTSYYEIDNLNNIIFFDYLMNEIDDFIGYISPFDGKFYTDINELIKQSNTHRISSGVLYIIKEGDKHHIIELTNSLSSMSVSDTIKAIINKILLFSPDNTKSIVDIVSIILGAPFVMSPNGEVVINVSNNKIVTDKYEYYFNEFVSTPKIGDELKFCEPVVKLCNVNNESIKHNINYVKLNKVTSFNNNLFNEKLFSALNNNLIYIEIPIDIASGNNEALKNISLAFKNLKIILAESISSKYINEKLDTKISTSNILKDSYTFDTIEEHSIKVYYYTEHVISELNEKHSYIIDDKASNNISESSLMNSLKVDATTLSHSERSISLHKDYSLIKTTEYNFKESLLKDYLISELMEQSSNIVQNIDTENIFLDKIKLLSIDKENIKATVYDKKTITTAFIDSLDIPSDKINISSSRKSSFNTLTNNLSTSQLKRKDFNFMTDKLKNRYMAEEHITSKDNIKTINIDKDNVSVYNTNTFKTLSIETNIYIVKSDNELNLITKDILETNDEMFVDSNTNIDKE